MIRCRIESLAAITLCQLLIVFAGLEQLASADDSAILSRECALNLVSEFNGTCSNSRPKSRPQANELKAGSRNIELKAGQNFMSGRQIDIASEMFFYDEERKDNRLIDYIEKGLVTKFISAGYSDHLIHRYDTFEELRDSNPADTNQETCLKYLTELNERADASAKLGQLSRDIEFLRTMDTFGRQQSGTLAGDTFWMGSYDACKRLTIRYQDNQKTRNRYCIASLRFGEQMAANELEQMAAIKTAVCLPRVCDAQPYKDKYQLIWQLVRFSVPDLDKFGARLGRLHCLPDEGSPLRTWWQSRPTLLVVSCASAWILLLVFATYKDERRVQVQKVTDEASADEDQNRRTNIYRSLSITNNLRSLLRMDTKHTSEAASETIVNLDMIEGIKVLSACYIITGHVIMIATMIAKDGQELGPAPSMIFRLSNLMPAFAVNAFFVITGLLTSYLIFKQNQSHSLILSPAKWVAFTFYRYLRIMPVYALVTLFSKHVARYIGDGPYWDYGTSSLAARRTCEQEPWGWTLLLGANFKSPLKHCIPSGWYMANDFQFLLVTPIFLAALHLRPKFGKALLMAVAAVGYLAGYWGILASEAHDLRPVLEFMPHGFMTYVTFLYGSYTQPLYRIPSYLIGLLFGHMLYQYECQRRAHLEAAETHQGSDESEQQQMPEWPSWMRRYGTGLLVFVISTFVTSSFIHFFIQVSAHNSLKLAAFILPTYHLVYAFGFGIYILLATTGHGNKFINGLLTMKFWKPLARLSLSVVLVNCEVIYYLVQTYRNAQVLDNQFLIGLNFLTILATYLVAIFASVLFEVPIRNAMHLLVAGLLKRQTISSKKRAKLA